MISAGLLMYRMVDKKLEIFLAHPGGPYFKKKDLGYWTIPKGIAEKDESLLHAAQREFQEETGMMAEGPFIHLDSVRQKGGKVVHAWAFEYHGTAPVLPVSNTFSLEWPPKSGKLQDFPEIDQSAFFPVKEALEKINEAQSVFIERLASHLGYIIRI